jgi:hypothetical protein
MFLYLEEKKADGDANAGDENEGEDPVQDKNRTWESLKPIDKRIAKMMEMDEVKVA